MANSSGTGLAMDGDWICDDASCGNINFARRTSCNRCKKERVDRMSGSNSKIVAEIGKSAAEKSRGLFSADDWQCNKCANVNWARRSTCNVCNAPKFGEVEERTGYGGGYNERGVVEYRRRQDSSDDEFDEFGRRKKIKRRSEGTDKKKKSRWNEQPIPSTFTGQDEFDAIAVAWAAKLRRLNDVQKVLAEDLINSVLKRAFFHELTRETTINDDVNAYLGRTPSPSPRIGGDAHHIAMETRSNCSNPPSPTTEIYVESDSSNDGQMVHSQHSTKKRTKY